VVAVVQPAGGLMPSLHLKSVVIGGKAGVGRRAPFHLDREARRACFGAVSAAEVDGISAAGPAFELLWQFDTGG
jgi:hypothetical protein